MCGRPHQRACAFRRGPGLARWSHADARFAGRAGSERGAQRAAGDAGSTGTAVILAVAGRDQGSALRSTLSRAKWVKPRSSGEPMKAFPPPRAAAVYNPGLRTLHWLMAALIFVGLPLGVWASPLPS